MASSLFNVINSREYLFIDAGSINTVEPFEEVSRIAPSTSFLKDALIGTTNLSSLLLIINSCIYFLLVEEVKNLFNFSFILPSHISMFRLIFLILY